MKIRLVGAELFHVERRTDERRDRHDEANSRFSQFCNATETYMCIKTNWFCFFPPPWKTSLNVLANTKAKELYVCVF